MSEAPPRPPLLRADRPRRLPDRSLRARIANRFRMLRGKRPLDVSRIGDAFTIGRYSYFKPQIEWQWGDTGHVSIGNFSCVAHDSIMMVGGTHPADWVSTFPLRVHFGEEAMFEDGMPATEGDIVIGNDAYVGRQARILPGVTVGDGAVVGAFAVVPKDVRPYAIVVGNPAREVRRRFDDATVERLLRIRWWDWPDEMIREAIPLLSSGRIDEFLERYDPDQSAEPEKPTVAQPASQHAAERGWL